MADVKMTKVVQAESQNSEEHPKIKKQRRAKVERAEMQPQPLEESFAGNERQKS